VPILLAHQIVAQQNAMDGAARQIHPCLAQQNLQLARTPVGITPPPLHHLLFQSAGGLPWTVMRSPTAFCNPFYAGLTVTLQP